MEARAVATYVTVILNWVSLFVNQYKENRAESQLLAGLGQSRFPGR